MRDIRTQRLVRAVVCGRLRQVAGEGVVQSRDVGRALDGRVAAQGHNAAAGPTHVAEQQLQDSGSTYYLHAGGVLRPSQRISDAGGPLASGVAAEQFRHAHKFFHRTAAHLGDDLRRVACKVPTQDLHDATRILQGRVDRFACHVLGRRGFGVAIHAVAVKPMPAFRVLRLTRMLGAALRRPATVPRSLVAPMALLGVIGVVLCVEATEKPGEIFGIPEPFVDDGRSVGVGQHVFVKPTVVA